MTLHSGAALARSSSLVSATDPVTAHRDDGDVLCLDPGNDIVDFDDHSKYDLGEPPSADACTIPSREYFTDPDNPQGSLVLDWELCQTPGQPVSTFYYQDQGPPVMVNGTNGILVSTVALTSVLAAVTGVTDCF